MMKKTTLFILMAMIGGVTLFGQQYFTRSGHITFLSEALEETIEAHNYQATSILDTETGEIVFSMLIKGFEFEKALMQEHFNEKYLQSDKFPKATFDGKITNPDEVDFSKDGVYEVIVNGKLTIHGVTNSIETKGTLEVKDGKIYGKATFPVTIADFKIKIPDMVRNNIAKAVDVNVDVVYEPLKK
jgi:YceI-like domain